MALPFVLIEVAPPPEFAEHQVAMLTACNEAVRQGSCVVASEAPAGVAPAALAIVSWEGPNKSVAHIQVGLPRGPKTSWLSREMQFRSADAPVERWRAVGFAIGTLAEEQEARRAEQARLSEPPAAQPVARPRQLPVPSPGRESPTPRIQPRPRWIGIGAMTGPGLDQGTWRAGLWGQFANRVGNSPWHASVSSSYSQASPGSGVSLDWFTVAAGAGASLAAMRKLELRGRAELGWQLARASVDDEMGRTDRGARWAFGPRVGLQSAWHVSDGVAFVAGLEGWWLSRGTEIRLRGERLGSSPSLGGAAQLGIEIFLP